MITYRGSELHTAQMCFDLPEGYFEPAEVDGSDWKIPGRPGLLVRSRVKRRRNITLEGYVRGIGQTPQERSESWHDAMVALMSLMDFSAAPGLLTLSEGYLGIPAGEEWSIEARATNVVPGPVLNHMSFQRLTFGLVAVGNPPEWTETGS